MKKYITIKPQPEYSKYSRPDRQDVKNRPQIGGDCFFGVLSHFNSGTDGTLETNFAWHYRTIPAIGWI